MKTINEQALEIIKDLKEDGFDNDQIKEAMEDGEYIAKAGYSEGVADEVWNICSER